MTDDITLSLNDTIESLNWYLGSVYLINPNTPTWQTTSLDEVLEVISDKLRPFRGYGVKLKFTIERVDNG